MKFVRVGNFFATFATMVATFATMVAEVATMVAEVAKPHILLMKYIFCLSAISLKLKELVILAQSLKNLKNTYHIGSTSIFNSIKLTIQNLQHYLQHDL